MRMPKIKCLSLYKNKRKKELLHAYLIKGFILILLKLMIIKNHEFIKIKTQIKTPIMISTIKT